MTFLYAHQKGFHVDWKEIGQFFGLLLLSGYHSVPTEDILGKIQPMYEELNKNLQQFGIFHKDLSIDESMVPYYGHHSCKMFIRGKPIRFSYKVWLLCSNNGYPFTYNMEIYGGKSASHNELLGSRVVNNLLSVVENPLSPVFIDEWMYVLSNCTPENAVSEVASTVGWQLVRSHDAHRNVAIRLGDASGSFGV
ncbi:hypothetical protein PR048_001367 [Dryococelus australis]|uniref:PiggyBac transposable element-derived protein domain-containing protein n=1 Tax=Dryococelus australis TaxID=614101 RepID=A0ABQ9IH97_9NEOP|nr:hypothetical protein PR048_001367 [Dryococelus australis]